MNLFPTTLRPSAGLALGAVLGSTMLLSGAWAVDLNEIKQRQKVVVATEAAFAPFELIEDGEIVGYDKDILDLVIANWSVELEQLDVPFAGILAGLDQGKYDLVSTALMITPENVKKYALHQSRRRGYHCNPEKEGRRQLDERR